MLLFLHLLCCISSLEQKGLLQTIPIAFLISPDVFKTVRLQSLVRYMKNWRVFLGQRAGNAALTQHLAIWRGITSTNLARTFWVQRHQPVKRGNLTYKKKAGNICTADNRVGNARDASFFHKAEG